MSKTVFAPMVLSVVSSQDTGKLIGDQLAQYSKLLTEEKMKKKMEKKKKKKKSEEEEKEKKVFEKFSATTASSQMVSTEVA